MQPENATSNQRAALPPPQSAYQDHARYDHRNRMTAVIERTAGGVESARYTYSFDAINRRIAANEAGQLAYWGYDGLNPAVKMGTGGTMISRRMYSRNLDLVIADQDPTQTRWFLVDQVGSTRDLVSNEAGVIQRQIYDSYGRQVTASPTDQGNDLLFTSREITGGTKIGYFRARSYDIETGRFLSPDPVLPRSYTYAGNSPIRYRDNLGLMVIIDLTLTLRNFVQPQIKPLEGIGGAIAGLIGGTSAGMSFQNLTYNPSSVGKLKSNLKDLTQVLASEDPSFAIFYAWLQSLDPIAGTTLRDQIQDIFFDVLSYYLDEIK